jgi:uncharacterized protein (UPF0147 family)
MLVAFVLSACEKKNAAIQNELRLIEKTVKDTTQPESIQKSAATFEKILKQENNVLKTDWIGAKWQIMELRNKTTISTHVAFLKALEKMIPNELPSPEQYDSQMDYISRRAEIIESNVSWSVVMMSECIKEIPLYNDPIADEEVSGVLKRLNEKHSNSETGKKILEFLNMVHEQGFRNRARGIKPWESPKTPRTL